MILSERLGAAGVLVVGGTRPMSAYNLDVMRHDLREPMHNGDDHIVPQVPIADPLSLSGPSL